MERRFDYKQAQEIGRVFKKHNIRYLFIGKSGAIILGFPDTTQDADVFVEKTKREKILFKFGKGLSIWI